jgi:hypothetical protein
MSLRRVDTRAKEQLAVSLDEPLLERTRYSIAM